MNLFSPLRSFTNKRPRILLWRRDVSSQQKPCDPLRILFCGADDFSGKSLEALHHKQHFRDESIIESIEVVCRRGKRAGRGLKAVRNGMVYLCFSANMC
jgi:ABC-type antimicrobial peptide transport system ATPase subunit